jgi:muramoyltetrapeptide carboxypeptidase
LPSLKKARAIRPGARIGIAAPASVVDEAHLAEGERSLERMGFVPVRPEGLLARMGFLAGDDERRAAELTRLIEDPDIDAVICARGGYGSSRIIKYLDPKLFRSAAKPLVGYSDITTLLLWQRKVAGLMGIHGPMLELASGLDREVASTLQRALTGAGTPPRLPGKTMVGGWAEGRLTGGSLTLVAASLGTPWEIDTRGAILMLEDTTELPYRMDRMLSQLEAAGKLSDVVGIGIGSTHDCIDARYPDRDVETIFRDFFEGLDVPVVTDLPFGHCTANMAWPMGGRAAIDAHRGEIEILESAVASR